MPIYTLECNNQDCEDYKVKKDVVCSYDERINQKCEKCEKNLHYIPSQFGFSINGPCYRNGWS
jgi:predicted nucleic acid-binding Zn ribbon protein